MNLDAINNFGNTVFNKETGGAGKPLEVRIALVEEDPSQPRKEMSEESLKELADSIKNIGVQQPILVKQKGEKYIIVAGHRRYKASILAGKALIPVLLDSEEFEKQDVLTRQLAENIQREGLNPFEIANALQELMTQGNKQKDLTSIVNKGKNWVSEHLRLLELPEHIKELYYDGKCKGVAALLALDKVPAEQQEELKSILANSADITVQNAKDIVKKLSGEDTTVLDEFTEADSKEKEKKDKGEAGEEKGDKFKKPTFRVSIDGLEAIILMKKKPSYEGQVWIKMLMDGEEKELDITTLSFLCIQEDN